MFPCRLAPFSWAKTCWQCNKAKILILMPCAVVIQWAGKNLMVNETIFHILRHKTWEALGMLHCFYLLSAVCIHHFTLLLIIPRWHSNCVHCLVSCQHGTVPAMLYPLVTLALTSPWDCGKRLPSEAMVIYIVGWFSIVYEGKILGGHVTWQSSSLIIKRKHEWQVVHFYYNCHGKWKRHLEDTANQVTAYVYVPQHFTMLLGNTLEVKNVVAPFMPWTAGITKDCQVPSSLVWYGNLVGLILPNVYYTHGFEDEGAAVEEVGLWLDEGGDAGLLVGHICIRWVRRTRTKGGNVHTLPLLAAIVSFLHSRPSYLSFFACDCHVTV